jgi:hypothetical protein
MKRVLLVLCVVYFSLGTYAQVVIHLDSEPMVPYNGDTVFVVGTESVIYPYMHVINPTGVAQNFKWRRVILDSTPGYTDQLCDDVLCFDCFGNPWTRPAFISVPALDSTVFQPKLNANGVGGTAHFRYYILDGTETIIDSVDVSFSTTVTIDESEKLVYDLYPNPANGMVTLMMPAIKGEIKFVLFNMVGAQVLTQTLVEGSNTINCDQLQNGIYFYSIVKNNEIVETKKLVVRH